MPATEPLPSIRELLAAAPGGVVGHRYPDADVRRGAVYDHFAGAGAILFSREAARDRDLFRAVYLDTAEGDDLAKLARLRYGARRTTPTFGTGTAMLTRPTLTAGAGTLWEGTRILVFGAAASCAPASYAIARDTPVDAATSAVSAPIRATRTGPGTAVDLSGAAIARIDEPLWDPSWEVASLRCSDGTALESSAELRARARATQLLARRGYADAITRACVAQGATYVALFDSNFGASSPLLARGLERDWGLCHCYVADAGFTTPARLLRACTAALERYRVCGADLQVLGMQRVSLDVSAVVTLSDDPGRLPNVDVALRDALAAAFSTTRYDYDLDELAGILASADRSVQTATFSTPLKSAGITLGGPMPHVLARYDLGVVTLRYAGPS